MIDPRRIGRISLVIIINIVLFCILLEGLLHIYNPLPATVRANRVILHANNTIVYQNSSNDRIPKKIVFSTNSLGFRGEEPPKDFQATLTVLTVGGSTTEDRYSLETKTWPALLGEKVKNDFSPGWLNNAGIAGHSTWGHIALMRDYVVKLRPRLVFFLVGLNDVAYDPITPEEFENKFNFLYNRTDIPWSAKVLSMLYRSELFNVIISVKRTLAANKKDLPHDLTLNLRSAPHKIIPEEDLKAELEKTAASVVPQYRRRLSYILQLCHQSGIQAAFLTQPVLYGKGSDPDTGTDLESIAVGDSNGLVTWKRLELLNDAVRDLEKDGSTWVVDLANLLPKRSKYYYDFHHYTLDGDEAIAQIVYDNVREKMKKRFSSFLKETGNVP